MITKRRTSAFAGSDLDIVLWAHDVTSIVLAGAATSAVIAATAYDAADRDLAITVLSDACGDPEPDAHEFLTGQLFPGRVARPHDYRLARGNSSYGYQPTGSPIRDLSRLLRSSARMRPADMISS